MQWVKSKLWANTRRIGVPCCPNCNASLIDVQKKSKVFPLMDDVLESDIGGDMNDMSHNPAIGVRQNRQIGADGHFVNQS